MEITRPIVGIENRTAQEVFDIMCDRIRLSAGPVAVKVPEQWYVDRGTYSCLIYSLMESGWRKGEPVMVNDVMIRVESSPRSRTDVSPIVDTILSALSPAPVSAEPQPEPVAWTSDWQIERVSSWGSLGDMGPKDQFSRPVPLFTSPQDLAAENARLRETLEEVTSACEKDCGVPTPADEDDEPIGAEQNDDGSIKPMALTFGMLRRARAALADQKGPRND